MNTPFAELTGRLEEFEALRARLAEASTGLLVVSAPPRSGTTRLFGHFSDDGPVRVLVADARSCRDELDLAMAVGDASVAALAAGAAGWWTSGATPASPDALRLARALETEGIDVNSLRVGVGPSAERLDEAFRLTAHLLDGRPGVVVLDHFAELLAGLDEKAARALLAKMRALLQRKGTPGVVIVEPPDGPVVQAFNDPQHPMYRFGGRLVLERAHPDRFVSDMAITRPALPSHITAPLIHAAAELAEGVPDLVWGTVRLAALEEEPAAAAATGFARLLELNAALLGTIWSSLRRVHPHAQTVVAAVAVGAPPTQMTPNPRSATNALERLKLLGIAWQPRPRTWVLADPLFASWVRLNAPPWARRSRVVSKTGGAAGRARGGGVASRPSTMSD